MDYTYCQEAVFIRRQHLRRVADLIRRDAGQRAADRHGGGIAPDALVEVAG